MSGKRKRERERERLALERELAPEEAVSLDPEEAAAWRAEQVFMALRAAAFGRDMQLMWELRDPVTAFTFGHVRRLEWAAEEMLARRGIQPPAGVSPLVVAAALAEVQQRIHV